ncbi:hypothetical protein QF026_004142 [Streptomyces aurantiacus]|uniref:hypothetical protein n=1 Tax=Streptomyces aurantiacus TaxID=47760 RepID=UPI0027932F8C|nr:hypothetical protein [Streptomyces aurantiacus]MDQ0775676.1 hypothetical protein [Streptomyces aurantiacus]
MAKITTTHLLTREPPRERMSCPLTDEELDQGPDVLANLYAPAAERARAQGLLSAAEPVRGQSTRGR